MKQVRLGVIGCGDMGGTHQKGYKELEDVMTVTVTVDIVLEKAQRMAKATGAEFVFTDYRDIVDHVDVVLIALPHHLHYEAGMFFMRAGKHVLMEKPMALNEKQCLDLIETSRTLNRILMTGYPMRFHPFVTKVKELIDQKVYGEVFQVSIWTEQFTKYPEGHWALSAATLGGGQFFSHGCHYVDLLLWLLGSPVKGVHMGTNLGTPWMENEGTSHATLEFESGAIGYHAGTWGARGTKLRYSIHVHCTKGMIEADFKGNKLYVHNTIREERAENQESDIEVIMDLDEGGKLTHHEIRHFIDCVHTGQEPLTNGPVSLQGLRVIWKLYEAEKNGVIADLRGLGLAQHV